MNQMDMRLKRLPVTVLAAVFSSMGLGGCGGAEDLIEMLITPASYTAIAWKSGHWYVAENYSTAAEAENAALAGCRRVAGETCVLAGRSAFGGCGAIAESDAGAFYLTTGDTRQVALDGALARCRAAGGSGCHIDTGEDGEEAVYGSC